MAGWDDRTILHSTSQIHRLVARGSLVHKDDGLACPEPANGSGLPAYLDRFRDVAEEAVRRPARAFKPVANDAPRGLLGVNANLVGFAGGHSGHTEATLDMDATLIGTHKRQARYCCKKHKAYQPPTTYWHLADLVFHSEFRDGNVNSGYEQLTTGVSKVMIRSDSAGCQKE